MGMHWGELNKNIRGIITYSLSPYEQKAFAGAISKGVPNMFRRVKGQIFRVAPPFVGAYLIYDWAKKEHARLQRKDPAEFANDE
ncbi:cytochrome b-c1 complex subunit 8-like [Physella acuta]|uniref:cytochrome b-c1 complex subunit 8-like n=1 Tax=Physella acuta TaxID=109671 RepID=UPI0027DBD76B|nr:cytochrome b-c1 complex subunit 8-like [Physella acuta]XP_059144297.1 cytochrome b-c1 complex subunit 8-like [Physella acuta]